MALNVVDSALNKFNAATDRISHFVARLNKPSTNSPSLYTCQVRRDQMRALWDKVEKEYEACSCVMSDEMTTDELPTIQAKYDYCYLLYEQCSAQLSEQIADASQALTPRTPVQPQAVQFMSTRCRLPPCDTEVFGGDYTRWPTFRDLFTAIYIQNPRLSEVEKLFQLNSKTSGEAHAIVSKSPLTNEGFQSAWSSLTERFLQMGINDRVNYIKQQKLCLNCAHSCFTCKGRHHTLLHRVSPAPTVTTPIPSPIQSTSTQSANVQSFMAVNTQGVLLSTAVIHVCHLGVRYTARALIDSGSEATFLSEKLFKRLRMPPDLQIEASAYVLPQLAGNLPSCTVPQTLLDNLPSIQLADPKFFESSQIDVLLGADILPSILLVGSHPNICGTLLGQETIFGWILTGPVSGSISKSISSFSARLSVERTPPLEEILSKFWEVEDLPASPAKESDLFCEANFNATTVRTSTGRYRVTLPFRDPGHVDLGHSRATALAQFLRNESRLKRNDSLKEQYDSVIQEYLDLGHMTQVPPSSSGNYYLPHHAVLKPDSTTTKLRIVFNASSPTSNGKSLNDILHTGPILQSDLTIQILKWRFFQFVFNADITKMYRQILVDPKHTRFQRLLFRTRDEKLCDFELNTVTFGVNCAPYLAIRVLHQLASDVRGRYPLASDIIANYMYVDDVLAGAHTKQAAVSAIDELRTALESAGFPLRWLAPVVIWAKIFMQEIWKQEIGWYNSLPADLTEQWTSFLQNYSSLQDIRIPRWTKYTTGARIQFHGFYDASQSAYGAALYARVETAGQVSVSLLAAKTRVAPIKTVSLPRLELCGALLLAELSAALLPHFPAHIFWHGWISSHATDLASRGVSPQELLASHLWWKGPEWLMHSPAQWPSSVIGLDTELKCRAVKVHAAQVLCEDFLDRFSRFDRALRVFAYVRRFAQRFRHPKVSFPETLSSQELAEAQERLIVQAQNRVYTKECASLRSHNRLIGSSDILSLNPFLDKQGVLRSCGRVRASTSLSYDERHPIILPFGCVFSRLLVSFTHQVSLYGGNQLVMRLVRTKFWIPKLRNLVKTVIGACKTCVIHRRKLQSQLMGNLPTARTKAIHLEATTDLTAEKFLEAFSRFVARRGCPLHMYSDNGKTFVGASSILSKDFVESTRTLILTTHSHQSLAWHFNPPGAPHMGGLWEAGVKSFKAHFYKTVSSVKHTFEELSTLLSKIEACLNSRPLSPMSEDVSDLAALTPGHFLVGGPPLSMAEPESREDVESIRNRWQRLKALHQHFCNGDMVVIREENIPPQEWRLGRVLTACPGADERVRVVDIQTCRGVFRRPVAKLVLLATGPTL
ncbi:uncharacterized protein LOC132783576 [Drosophila nasuta]|uniref:uncharacterized protein LOC132783576 n=1 Tax=Drosophila nasuta TaxID=42062 RepID=UPI00295EF335|nr:uncharacterized protein LOC132783576 [Drosophila nasuta]